VETQGTTNGYTGSCEGNPDPSARRNDQQRRPSPNLETGARSSGSVRSDRSNKFWSPGTNAPPATRASKTFVTSPKKGSTYPPSFMRTGSTCPPSFRRGLGGGHRCQAKGQINGRGFGRRRAPLAAGPRLRHEDVQNYPMGSGRAQTQGRNPGPRSGNVGSDRTREASSSISRTTRRC